MKVKLPDISGDRKSEIAKISFFWNGIQLRGYGRGKKGRRGKRGKIKGFSPQSRRRLQLRFSALDLECLAKEGWKGYFITLTYQADLSPHFDEAKYHLKKFFQRMERKFGKENFFSFWKLELTKRGVIHFHLATFIRGSIQIGDLRRIVNNFWVETIPFPVSDEILKKMEKASENVREINNYQTAFAYVAKYTSKTFQLPKYYDLISRPIGRFWGIANRRLYKRYVYQREIEIPTAIFFFCAGYSFGI